MVDHTQSNADRTPVDILRAEFERARANCQRLLAEYEAMAANPDVIQEDRNSAAQALETARGRVAQAEEALARAEAGDYGRCVECGAQIPAERLEVLPDTTTCVSCS